MFVIKDKFIFKIKVLKGPQPIKNVFTEKLVLVYNIYADTKMKIIKNF